MFTLLHEAQMGSEPDPEVRSLGEALGGLQLEPVAPSRIKAHGKRAGSSYDNQDPVDVPRFGGEPQDLERVAGYLFFVA